MYEFRHRFFLILLVGGILVPVAGWASCPLPDLKPKGEFYQADIVFTGTVLSKRYVDGDESAGWYYRVKVSQVLKGPAVKVFTVYNEDDSNRFPLDEGQAYLLFAYRRRGRLLIDCCGNSALLSKAASSIQQIQDIAFSRDGEIEGWLDASEIKSRDLSGIHVVVRGGSHVYRALTDNDGYFQFRAPSGTYTVDFSNSEYYVWNTDSFWYDPKHFVLHPGESAGLWLRSARCNSTQFIPPDDDHQTIPEPLKMPRAPKTAREVSCFTSLKKNTTMTDLVEKCGIPDRHFRTKNIHRFNYFMNDCSTVEVSTPDLQRLGISHEKHGTSTLLLNNW